MAVFELFWFGVPMVTKLPAGIWLVAVWEQLWRVPVDAATVQLMIGVLPTANVLLSDAGVT
jgi:hypothetical protein